MPKAKTGLLKSKTDLIKNLKESFAYCDATFATLDDQKVLASPQSLTNRLQRKSVVSGFSGSLWKAARLLILDVL